MYLASCVWFGGNWFGKMFSTFTGVWRSGKCWSTRNCFLIDHKIKTLIVEICLRFHFLYTVFILTQKLLTEPPLPPPPNRHHPLTSPVSVAIHHYWWSTIIAGVCGHPTSSSHDDFLSKIFICLFHICAWEMKKCEKVIDYMFSIGF